VEFFVSISGSDADLGNLDQPLRMVKRGVEALSASTCSTCDTAYTSGPSSRQQTPDLRTSRS
jgi:hypothetical protein